MHSLLTIPDDEWQQVNALETWDLGLGLVRLPEQCSRNYCLLSGCSAYSAVRGIWIEFLPAFLDWLRITLLNVKTKLNRSYDILHSSHLTHSEHLQFVWRGYINWPDLQTYSRQPQVFVCAILYLQVYRCSPVLVNGSCLYFLVNEQTTWLSVSSS